MFSRRDVLSLSAAGVLADKLPKSLGSGSKSLRPNILWLVSEDNGPFIGAYGDKLAHTPAIDRLAKRGLLYRHAYANAPVCSVSRFGILTGVYPQSCGDIQNHRTAVAHPENAKGYPAYLREAGYYCSNNPKTDYNTTINPASLWDDCSKSAHWRNRPAGAPFMSVFNFQTTHSSSVFTPTSGRVKPEDVTVPKYLPDTEAIRRDLASYYNTIEIMDGEVARLVAELEADGLAEDTLIFYFSDHGGVAPRSKQFCYENGLRVPLIVAIPEKFSSLSPVKMGGEIDSIVTFIDLAPTVLAVAGIAKPAEMAGTSFLGNSNASPQKYAFAGRNRIDERIDFTRTITDGRYRYIRNYMPHRPWGLHDSYMWRASGWQDWERLYLAGTLPRVQARFFEPKPFEELYDLSKDPDQTNNLSGSAAAHAKCQELRSALDRQMLSINDTGFIPEGIGPTAFSYPLEKIMDLAGAAARKDQSYMQAFQDGLTHEHEIVRFWSAQGLLLLGEHARPATESLVKVAGEDVCVHVRVIAAEAAAGLGQGSAAIGVLTRVLDTHPNLAVKQLALNSLNALVKDAAFEQALPSLQKWSGIEMKDVGFDTQYWTVRSHSRHLLDVFNHCYQPEKITYFMEKFTPQQLQWIASTSTVARY